jgi:3-hydroxyisobutyrate dehydrogenase-like beta-hydroxyacid dehydrogenase
VLVHDIDAAKRAAVDRAVNMGRRFRWQQRQPTRSDLRRLRPQLRSCCPAAESRAARSGTIVAILSTVHPDTVRELAQRGRGHGLHVVDATMCRGGWAADEGTLLSFVAGSAEIVSRLRPVLAAFSSDIIHTGDIGSAQVAKAVNNMMMWACLVADHEALALAHRYGLDVEMMRKALLTTHSTNGALEHWGKQTMAWADDDMEIVAAMAKEKGLSLPQAKAVQEICRALKPRRFQLDKYGA